jgi:Histidine kinase-, DNA gyrase B-, and HSP90-like ATPase
MAKSSEQLINAEPTKTFFVDMLTRDIPLEQAILDLIDNCVDGAKAMANGDEKPFDGRIITLSFDADQFKITDNCGGFSRDAAINYAFKFGRPAGAKRTDHSIGQFASE